MSTRTTRWRRAESQSEKAHVGRIYTAARPYRIALWKDGLDEKSNPTILRDEILCSVRYPRALAKYRKLRNRLAMEGWSHALIGPNEEAPR